MYEIFSFIEFIEIFYEFEKPTVAIMYGIYHRLNFRHDFFTWIAFEVTQLDMLLELGIVFCSPIIFNLIISCRLLVKQLLQEYKKSLF